jgi:hypothetical protein
MYTSFDRILVDLDSILGNDNAVCTVQSVQSNRTNLGANTVCQRLMVAFRS